MNTPISRGIRRPLAGVLLGVVRAALFVALMLAFALPASRIRVRLDGCSRARLASNPPTLTGENLLVAPDYRLVVVRPEGPRAEPSRVVPVGPRNGQAARALASASLLLTAMCVWFSWKWRPQSLRGRLGCGLLFLLAPAVGFALLSGAADAAMPDRVYIACEAGGHFNWFDFDLSGLNIDLFEWPWAGEPAGIQVYGNGMLAVMLTGVAQVFAAGVGFLRARRARTRKAPPPVGGETA